MVDPIDLYVGRRLRGRRLTMKMSQEQLGKTVGVTFQQIQKYENGKNRISGSRIAKMASALGVEPAISSMARPASAKGMAVPKKPLGSPSHSPIRP
jgi:transcriptional regulator with XRE-family HTH domain